MTKRKIIEINEEKCTGCGQCMPNCPEGALQVIDGKARLVSDLFCDGLGACVGNCPEEAMNVVEREAEPYEEKTVMINIVKAGPNTIKAHLKHLKEHGAEDLYKEAVEYLEENDVEIPEEEPSSSSSCRSIPQACPGSGVQEVDRKEVTAEGLKVVCSIPRLENWPVQIKLVPPTAPWLQNADLVIIADCVAYSYAATHEKFIKGKKVITGCPKLDERELYVDRLTGIVGSNDLKSITLVHMEVPCCYGFNGVLEEAIERSGKPQGYKEVVISIKGEIKV